MHTKRGSVLIGALLFSIVAAAIAYVIVSDTLNANQTTLREESYSDGLSAAEYGAEVAISEISGALAADFAAADPFARGGAVNADGWITGDAANRALFSDGTDTDADQRRIQGFYNDHEFRVRVRSANLAYRNDVVGATDSPLPAGWLFDPAASENYRNAYEITATARPRGVTTRVTGGASETEIGASTYSTPVVQITAGSPYSQLETLRSRGATVMRERPTGSDGSGPYLKTAETRIADADTAVVETGSGVNSLHATRNEYSVKISGEDHNLRTETIPNVTVSQRITTPLRLATDESRVFDSVGWFWLNGILTLNYIDIDSANALDAAKYKDVAVANANNGKNRTVKVPVPNPLRPYDNDNRTSLSTTTAELNTILSQNTVPKNKAMEAEYTDGRTIDTYLLGGKGVRTSPGVRPQTVDYLPDPPNPADKYAITGANARWAVGVITAASSDIDKFNIVLGSFEDLPKLYINIANKDSTDTVWASPKSPSTWEQMYVGQYSNAKSRTQTDGDSMPILGYYDAIGSETAKVRPQTIHMVLNEKDEMLVRAYEADIAVGYNKNTNQVYRKTFYFANSGNRDSYYVWGYPYNPDSDGVYGVAYTASATKPGPAWIALDGGRKQEWEAVWKGNYMWVKTKFEKNTNIYTPKVNETLFRVDGNTSVALKSSRGSGTTLVTNTHDMDLRTGKNGEICTPRQFFWQELVGYSLEKDWSSARYGEPALIDDGLGIANTTNNDNGGQINPRGSSLRTYAYEDDSGQKRTAGFDEAYQRNPRYNPATNNTLYDPANAGRWKPQQNHPNAAIRGLNYPAYLVDAHDSIFVYNPDRPKEEGGPGLEEKKSMNDFLYTKAFIMNPGTSNETQINREAVALLISYEDQLASGNGGDNYNYQDIFFTVFVSPRATDVIVEDVTDVGSKTTRWWELDETAGLTGELSHPALGVNMQEGKNAGGVEFSQLSDEELRKDHFSRFQYTQQGEGLIDNVWTMHEYRADEQIDFPLARFVPEGQFNKGVLDTDDPFVSAFTAPAGASQPVHSVFYCIDPDLLDYIQYRILAGDTLEDWWAPDPGADPTADKDGWRRDKAVAEISNVTALDGGHYTFKRVKDRWDGEKPDQPGVKRTEKTTLGGKDAANNYEAGSLEVFRKPYFFRQVAGEIAGSEIVPGKTILMENATTPAAPLVVEDEIFGYIAGETKPDGTAVLGGYTLVETKTDGAEIHQGTRKLRFPEEADASGSLREGYAKLFLAASTNKADTDNAVKLCYDNSQFYEDNKAIVSEADLQAKFGIKDDRYAIGFHRSGKDYDFRKDLLQDQTEIVILGAKGFAPFPTRTAPDANGNNVTGIMKEKSTGAIVTNYTAAAAPTFTFEGKDTGVTVDGNTIRKPVDGAGALIVNGNLHIKNTFAYHGVLIVLGDIIVEPVASTEYVYDAKGRPLGYDKDGKTLIALQQKSGGKQGNNAWQKIVEDGDKVTYEDGSYTPLGNAVFHGELIVQGMLMVKGEIKTLRTQGPDGYTYTGAVHALWSSEAVDSALGAVGYNRDPLLRRIAWTHDDDIDVHTLWNDIVDFPAPAPAPPPVQ